MTRANLNDKQLVTDILSAAFNDNLSVNYILKQDKKREKRLRALIEYSYDVCYSFGDIWLSEDRKACALITYPHRKKDLARSIWFDLKLIAKTIGIEGIGKALSREAKIKAKQPKIPMVYLWFIGVAPTDRGQGIGEKMMKEIIEFASFEGLSVYLETSTARNLPWYEKLGFQCYDTLNLTYVLYFLKYETSK